MAKAEATFTNPIKVSGKLFLWIIVMATTVEADPIGVMFPPRFAP